MTEIPEYHKIDSLYKRDQKGRFTGEYAQPEFGYLWQNEWVWTEKVDGTNVRAVWSFDTITPFQEREAVWRCEDVEFEGDLHIGGRTNNASWYPKLLEKLIETFRVAPWAATFPHDCVVMLHGEGYGAKIQKGGGNYCADGCDFVLFDVQIFSPDMTDPIFLERHNVKDIAKKLNVAVVPIVGCGTLPQAERFVQEGFVSQWGKFPAEGIVLRPATELQTRRGRRVITKLKTKDYK